MTYCLVYVSSASGLFDRSDLDDILRRSRRNNAALDVSGALLYADGNMMQVLEGEQRTVAALYARIERDPRHRGLIVLFQGNQASRQFADWSMAFGDLELTGSDTSGYSDFLRRGPGSTDFGADPGVAQKLLLSFRKSLSRV